MPTTLEIAIEKIRSASNHMCTTQVYCFDDYDPEKGDATSLCKRLGIPLTEDIVIEFPIGRTFNPMSRPKLTSFSRRLKASLPADYESLLAEFGAFHLPGNSDIALFSPTRAIEYTCNAWGFSDPSTMPVVAVSRYNHDCDGDAIGYVRSGNQFAPELYQFKHERRYVVNDLQFWSTRIAGSLPEFLVSYLDSLI